MTTDNIIMSLVHKGKSRQEAHEHMRQLSHESVGQVKEHGKDNDMIERTEQYSFYEPIWEDLP